MRPKTIDLFNSANDAQKIHAGVNADLFRIGDYAVKVFRRDSPRAGNEFRTYALIDGNNGTPRAFDFIKPQNQQEGQRFGAAFCLDWVKRCEKKDERQLGVAIANFHSMQCSPVTAIKYTSDPLPLSERLQAVAQALKPAKHAIAEYVVDWIVERVDSIGESRGLVHRDLIETNVIWAIDGPAIIDWEWGAYASPAWDFVKLRRWLTGRKRKDFEDGYRSSTALPPEEEIRFFDVFEQFTDACRVGDLEAITNLGNKL